MTEFPRIACGDVMVRPFTEQHLTDRYVAWLNDPEVVRYSEQRHRAHTLQSCDAYFRSVSASGDLFLAVETSGCGHVGNIGVAIDQRNGVADISILIGDPRVRGAGVGSQAWQLVMQTLFDRFWLRKLTAGTMSVNQPMLRLMQRSMMDIEGVRPRHFLWEGKEVDLVLAAAFRP